MISYIRGELAGLERDKAIVDVQGVGYGIYMPEQSLSLLGPIGCEVKIHTYLNVREDAMQLFGFLTRDDLEVFRLVIGVSGIGPKGGLNILSCLSADELKFAVLSGDAKAICAAPGIGKKTAADCKRNKTKDAQRMEKSSSICTRLGKRRGSVNNFVKRLVNRKAIGI